ncbi:type II toxin-antitoxin system VapC family toxin [Selenomonas sp. KH1T6]|uniref:type II toxin-antitoxin system VapC family toxin n=1 Tax=Selenomonas sp. KH1T6 TaxID=3158784 RepID=UPI0008A78127|nr:PIN domain nuclease, a component of toxin-antitoxin system (PIN domain) [Selenomonas ruminantium]
MRYLLDTHIILWALMNQRELTARAREIIENDNHVLYYSTVSLWEIAIKHKLHPDVIPNDANDILGYLEKSPVRNLPLQNNHIVAMEGLHRADDAPRHKDPFDRILLAQAKAEGMCFLTHDKMFVYYDDVQVEIV